eukprot:maker-scaffold278_size225338-snap-gene-1.27 protein:Tk03823 transcript:maker-scaffold278_size225338-snap-gene-1.27-mRNA-1 annotation:"lytic transglycosylase"
MVLVVLFDCSHGIAAPTILPPNPGQLLISNQHLLDLVGSQDVDLAVLHRFGVIPELADASDSNWKPAHYAGTTELGAEEDPEMTAVEKTLAPVEPLRGDKQIGGGGRVVQVSGALGRQLDDVLGAQIRGGQVGGKAHVGREQIGFRGHLVGRRVRGQHGIDLPTGHVSPQLKRTVGG